jgi:RND family efflux transporter MFP subunit
MPPAPVVKMPLADLKDDLASLRLDRGTPSAPRARRWPLIALALVLGAAALLAWQRGRQALAVTEVRIVRPGTLQPGSAPSGVAMLTASGYVVARREAVVSAKIQGRLSELRVEEGSRVHEGEILARLESGDYAAQVERARASVGRAEAELAESRRQLRLAEDLNRSSVLSADQLDAARSRVAVSEAALRQAEAERTFATATYQNTFIRAPFSGTVVKKMAEVGESVAPIPPGVNLSTSSGAIVALADLDTLEVEADVAEANVARLGPGQAAEVTVEAFPERNFKAVLRQVLPTADRTKATVQVKVTILEKDEALKPEMSARVNFLEPPASTGGAAAGDRGSGAVAAPLLTVPDSSVINLDGAPHVLEVVGGRVRARRLVTAGSRQGQTLVRDGLTGSEMLVASPPPTLHDGDSVRIRG